MDGTLFDTENIAKESWNAAAKQFGFIIDKNFHDQLIGLPKGAYSKVVEETLPKHLDREAFDQFKSNYFLEFLKTHGLPIKPGMLEILEYLKHHNIQIALATSTWRDRLDLYFTYMNIRDYFAVMVTGDQVTKGKPNPEIYEQVVQQLHISKTNLLAIEDSPNGILSATSAGIKTIVVPDCIQPPYDLLRKCLTRAENLFEVKTIIEHL